MSSTGQFAGIEIIAAKSGVFELAATIVLVNLRYVLMSAALTQSIPRQLPNYKRLIMAFGVTDEIFALNISRFPISFRYYVGTMVLPLAGWTAGTVTGAYIGEVLPQQIQAAVGILLYAMFIAIVVPPAKACVQVRIVMLIAALVSTLAAYLPVVSQLQIGWRIIISTIIAAGIGATLWSKSGQKMQTKKAR